MKITLELLFEITDKKREKPNKKFTDGTSMNPHFKKKKFRKVTDLMIKLILTVQAVKARNI